LSEGIVPSNEGRGYVLRRILRRALRFAYLLEKDKPFMCDLVDPVIDQMGGAWPEIKKNVDHVKHVIRIEEEQFMRTVGRGSQRLDELVAQARDSGSNAIPGADAFELHATHGFPIDLTEEVAHEAGVAIDRRGYDAAMKQHQELARASWKGAELGAEAELLDDVYESRGATTFVGYDEFVCEAHVVAIVKGGARADEASEGDAATIVLDETPFYANSGGQVGDTGAIESDTAAFAVADTQKTPSAISLHFGKVTKGRIAVGDAVAAKIDVERRRAIMRNHTAAHMMQGALKRVLGDHVTQRGSEVGPDALRFDFTHPNAMSPEEIAEIERLVAEHVCLNHAVTVDVMSQDEALKTGAIAPFGEKYGASVRVVRVGDWSIEFCGGSHLGASGEAGAFIVTSESSIAAGTRRIEAVTGPAAISHAADQRAIVHDVTWRLSAKPDEVGERIATMQKEIKSLRKEARQSRQQSATGSIDDVLANAKDIGGAKFLAHRFAGLPANDLRNTADVVGSKLPNSIAVLASVEGDRIAFVCRVDKSLTSKVRAGDLAKCVASICGGGGGGRPDMAQAGGKDVGKIPEAFAEAERLVIEALGQ
jgi:alanyl-tRNA synthetase